MRYWTDFGLRQMPSLSARRPAGFPPAMQAMIEERAMPLREPFRGLTTGGVARPGLFPLRATGVSTAPVTEAAAAFVGALSGEQRQRAVFPLGADERRKWLYPHPFVFRHGVMLEDLPPATRRLGLGLVQATLSARGFAQARDIVRLNGLLAGVTGRDDEYGEWLYFLSFFGEPGDGPMEWCRPVPPDEADALAARCPELTLRAEPAHQEAFVKIGDGQIDGADWQVVSRSLEAWSEQ